jgi:uncharacterized FlaG/YvyC family protein
MTVKELIEELQKIKPELQDKPVFTYDGEIGKVKVKIILKHSFNPLNQTPSNVIGVFIGTDTD